jgi:hypothetical protein
MGMVLLGRSAYDAGVELSPDLVVDELAADRGAVSSRDDPEAR